MPPSDAPIQVPDATLSSGGPLERHRAEEVMGFLATCGSSPDEDFFQSLARFLAGKLAMDFVCIDDLEGDGLTARTVAMWCDGQFQDNLSYALKNSPCGEVVGRQVCCFPASVAARFPQDEVLQELCAESYVGATLWGHTGQPIGLIAVIGRRALGDPAFAEAVLKLVAGRAAGELERWRAEAALRVREESYRRQFTDNTTVMLMVDPGDGRIIDANDAAVAFYGYPKERLLALHISDINTLSRAEIEAAMASVKARSGARFEFRHRLADGSFRDVQVSTSRLQLGERPVLLSIVHDITQRKQAEASLREREEQLRIIFEASEAGIILVSPRGEIRFGNRRMAEMFGVPPGALAGTYYPDHLHESEKRDGDAIMRRLIEGVVPSVSLERRYIRWDGTPFWGHLSGRRLENPDGSLRALVGVITDITERKQMEAERQAIDQKISQAQKMESLGSLAGGLAHDMNNVLGAILGLASAHIGDQPEGSPARQAFGTIIRAAERGGNMVKSLLNLARQSPSERRELDLNAILAEEARLLERTTLAKVRLVLDLAPGLRPIQGDASALANALMNLCVNAVEAMAESGTLTLGTRNLGSGEVEVRVQDTGCGMPRDILEKALDPFFTTKDVGKGTGLGLSIVYSTVKAHQGHLELRSEPGQGTCVVMRFPASEAAAAAGEPAPEPEAGARPRSLLVLLVDDDELIQSSTQAILEALGHRVAPACSGEEALAKVEEGLAPDVVVLDMNMPGLGGSGTLPRLRALRPQVPVLIATGRADQAALDLVQAHPDVRLLSKPFSMKDLQRHLEPFMLG